MRIQCQSVQAFLENLEGQKVYQKTVYVDKTRHAYGDDDRKASSWDIIFQASAIIEFEDEGQALVQLGVDCGVDRKSDGGEYNGSEEADVRRDTIEAFCKENDLTMRPGILDL